MECNLTAGLGIRVAFLAFQAFGIDSAVGMIE